MQRAEAVVSGQGFVADVRSDNLGEGNESEEEVHGLGGEGNHWCSFEKEIGLDEEREMDQAGGEKRAGCRNSFR